MSVFSYCVFSHVTLAWHTLLAGYLTVVFAVLSMLELDRWCPP
ncbi:hypothetical protein [Cryobacterium sp. GrIS_2_6]|nr:hypothetical protein [Cryobacterium psychrotolerans]